MAEDKQVKWICCVEGRRHYQLIDCDAITCLSIAEVRELSECR